MNVEQEIVAVENEVKWSWTKFLIGIAKLITKYSFIAYIIYTWFVVEILHRAFTFTNGDLITFLNAPVIIIMVAGWALGTVIIVTHLQAAFDAMIRNAKLSANIELKNSVTADAAAVIKEIKA